MDESEDDTWDVPIPDAIEDSVPEAEVVIERYLPQVNYTNILPYPLFQIPFIDHSNDKNKFLQKTFESEEEIFLRQEELRLEQEQIKIEQEQIRIKQEEFRKKLLKEFQHYKEELWRIPYFAGLYENRKNFLVSAKKMSLGIFKQLFDAMVYFFLF